MLNLDFAPLRELISGTFGLNPEVFQQIALLPDGLFLALLTVLLAGLSLSIGQAIILFINEVSPLRFVFSLLINAVLYTFGYLFLVFSTWLICLVPWSAHVSLATLTVVLGLSYAPLLFSSLGALPYLGVPLLSLLSIWHLLAMVVGFAAVTQASLAEAFGYVVFGWVVLQLLQQTIGQPIANLGRWLANTVAGVELLSRREYMREYLADAVRVVEQSPSRAVLESSRAIVPEAQQLIQSARRRLEEAFTLPEPPAGGVVVAPKGQPSDANRILLLLGGVGILILAYLVALLLEPVRNSLFSWHEHLPRLFKFIFDLFWIGIVAVAVAGLIAPLETLGWWAGWYNDEVNTTVKVGTLAEDIDLQQVDRYVIYLDGISQSSAEYLPDIEDFLDALAVTLPDNIAIIRGLMVYSVLNNPLSEDRPLAFLWRLADRLRFANPTSLLGLIVNIRNVLIVSVSADRRYGPLYNRGIAQVMYNSLLNNGYRPHSGIPITLIGYSGGGQMAAAAAPFLRRAIEAPISVISLGGVISGNCNILKLEHLYHLVGQQDTVEKLGPIMFPGRWKLLPLSFWNRAKRLGKISLISLGPVGHQVPGGLLDPHAYLPDGRSHLQQTIDYIARIVSGELLTPEQRQARQPSNYELYKRAAFNDPSYYPLDQTVDLRWYRPIAPWMGRLILPHYRDRSQLRGVLFEVHHAPEEHQELVGQIVKLRWQEHPLVRSIVRAVTHDVHFSVHAEYTSEYGGLIHPERLNHWQFVGPLESLAGSHPTDDIVVMLAGSVQVQQEPIAAHLPTCSLRIAAQPVQISGRYYGLVRFRRAIAADAVATNASQNRTDQFEVVHFNSQSRQFDGLVEILRMPPVVADQNGCFPSTTHPIERSSLNQAGWYIYGAPDSTGQFVVQSLAPRSLLRLQPDRVIFGQKPAYRYIRQESWAKIATQKGKISSVLLSPTDQSIQAAIDQWQVGDRALVLHVYGGIGGNKQEPAAATPIFFGHFAYGVAEVVQDALVNEPRFDIRYYQVYTHNTDGITAGTLHWSRYMGDRQFGWVGVRPVCDILIKLDAFTQPLNFPDMPFSALDIMVMQLQAMTARYRIGDGTGGTYVGPANNCAQDSNQALFAGIRQIQRAFRAYRPLLAGSQLQAAPHPDPSSCVQQLVMLNQDLKRELQPLGEPRSDWENNEFNLGSMLEDAPLRNLRVGLGSWRTLLPRLASDRIVRVFLKHNATVWVLRTTQIGGNDPDIEPIAPITL